ncbi:MAG: 3-phosphoshikimate 1-carboxyvinyltransferase [Polyangiaceae bacterium]
MSSLVVQPQRQPLLGSVPLPADALQATVALLIAAIATGESSLRARDAGPRTLAFVRVLSELGVALDVSQDLVLVRGTGLRGLRAPGAELDLGRDRFAAALLTGVLAGQGLAASVAVRGSARGLARLFKHLVVRGAGLTPTPGFLGEVQRVAIGALSEQPLAGCDAQVEPPDAAIKAALLLAGLYTAHGTAVAEVVITADHVERMLSALDQPIVSVGGLVTLAPRAREQELPAFEQELPGDTSLGAYVLAAAALVPESRVMTRGIGLNPTRTGILDVMRHMGVQISVTPHGERLGEPIGDVSVFAGRLTPCALEGELRLRAHEELPVVCALAACAEGPTLFAELEPLEPQRTDRLLAALAAFGVASERTSDGVVIHGAGAAPLGATSVDCQAEPEVALLATLLALRANGESRVRAADCIAEYYPRFVGTLRALGAVIGVEA